MIRSVFIRLLLIAFSTFAFSCSSAQESKKDQTQFPTNYKVPVAELSSDQEAAFDALNTLQTSTDERSRLYSTFANIHQACYPPDTHITLSQAEFLTAMQQFVAKHCSSLSMVEQANLAATAVLAQEEYVVWHCPSGSSKHDYQQGLPMQGTWVFPGVLGERDVILVW